MPGEQLTASGGVRLAYVLRGAVRGLILALGLTNCGIAATPCSAAIKHEVLSPDEKWKVVVFARTCSVLSSTQTGVSVLERQKTLGTQYPNVFNISAPSLLPPNDLRAVLDGIDVRWTSDSSMSIRYDGRATILYQVVRLWGLVVTYDCNRREKESTCQ